MDRCCQKVALAEADSILAGARAAENILAENDKRWAKFRSFRVICGRVRIEADPLTL